MSRLVIPQLRALRAQYIEANRSVLGITSRPIPSAVRTLDQRRAMAIADAFERASHSPPDATTSAAYRQFTFEVRLQWDLLANYGYLMEPWLGKGQPYAGSHEMQQDVLSRHLYFFLTASGFGEPAYALDQSLNPLLQPTDIVCRNLRLTANDLFRAVHDIFGHAQEGYEFGPVGEENAWRCHSTMFSDVARRAMTTETRGQNSWFNFGPHLRRADGSRIQRGQQGYLAPKDRPYAQQKTILLPDEFVFDASFESAS